MRARTAVQPFDDMDEALLHRAVRFAIEIEAGNGRGHHPTMLLRGNRIVQLFARPVHRTPPSQGA
jgi:hypothetical protein